MLVFAGALALPEAAQADCTPAFSSGQPPAGTTVTCTGTTDGNPAGYGDGSQTGLTIDVQPMATVKGVADGFALGATNVITNDGTISDDGANNPTVNGISTSGSIDLTNNQAGVISVATTSTDPTANAIGVNASTMVTGSNAGLISATASASEAVAIQSDAIDFTNTGTISASGSNVNGTLGVFAVQSLALTNSGTVSADGGTGATGTAVESDGTLNVINLAGGSITATETNTTFASVGVFAGGSGGGGSDLATISNAGTISGADIGVVSFSNTSTTITNTGTIAGTGNVATARAIRLVGSGSSSIDNAGVITTTGTVAIKITGSTGNTLTVETGSSITGTVIFTGSDALKLGGTGSDTFNVNNIGATQQYQGFSTFNKVGASTWTLTGSGTQNWTVTSGTLSGDTNSLGGSSLTDNATLEFNQNSDGTFAGVISGTGNLTKDGGGTVTFTGVDTYSGTTTISGGTLALSGSGSIANSSDVADNGTFDISAAAGNVLISSLEGTGSVVLGNNSLTLANANGDFGGVIGGSGGLTLSSGNETLSGHNTYSGGTSISAGAALHIGDGGTSGSIVGDVVDNGALTFNRSDTVTIGGAISGSGSVSQIGSGTTILTGSNNYSGGTTITGAGTLQIGNGGTSDSITGDVVSNGSLAFDRSDTLIFNGVISGVGNVNQIGTGTTILTAVNTYGSGTFILSGTLALSGSGSIANSSDVSVSLNSTFDVSAASGGVSIVSLEGNGNVVLGANSLTLTAAAGDFGGVIAGTGGLSVSSGSEILAGANTYSGGTTIASGAAVQLGAGGTSGSIVGNVLDNGTLAFDRSDMISFGGVISGTGGVQQEGGGTLILTAASTYQGNTLIDAGSTLALGGSGSIVNTSVTADGTFDISTGSSSAIQSLDGTGTVTLGANSLTLTNAAGTFGGVISGSTGGLVVSSGTETLTGTNTYTGGTTILAAAALRLGNGGTSGSIVGDVDDEGALVFNRSNLITFGGVISGGGEVNQFGSGTTILTGTNTYAGNTFIGSGTLALAGSGSIANSSDIVLEGGTFDISGATTGVSIVSLDGSGSLVLGGNTLTLTNAFFGDFSGVISGTGGLVVSSGTEQLSGANTYTGGTAISAGAVLQLGDGVTDGSIQGNVTDNGTFDVSQNTIDVSIASLDGSGTVTLGGNSLTLTAATGDFGGVIGGTGGLTVSGGTETLSGTNNYTGGTTISGGTLQVGNGGTSGSIQGDVVDNGTLAFDRSDTLTFNGVISGNGTLNQIGTGTTILTAVNTYGSGTFILAGTLALSGSGSIANSSDVSVNLNATFDISAATSGVSIVSLEGRGNVVLGANSLTLTAAAGDFGGVIAGTGGLSVSSGNETLSGNNTYTGGTTISSGAVLQLGDGGATGSITGDVVDNGALVFNRSGTLTIDGAISGTGSVSQIGSGTTILTGDSSFSGGTTISAGTLQIGDGNTSGSIQGDVVDNGTLAFNRSDVVVFSGAISGSGSLVQAGSGTTILTGNSTFTGGTTISAGTLQLGNNGTSGSVAGNIVDNGVVAIDHSNTVLIDNAAISGSGSLQQIGSGTTILATDNTYAGGTVIAAGTLQLGNGGTTGSIVGDVVDNATLAFNRSDAVVFGGAISGTGGLMLFGTSDVTLTGSYSYTGQTTIETAVLMVSTKGAQPRAVNTLVLAGGTNTLSGDIVDDGVLVGDATSLTLSGAISGSGSLSVKGGVTALGGANTFSGGTTVADGTLSISADDNLGTGGLALQNGSTLLLNGSFAVAHAITVEGDPTFDVEGSDVVEINAPITDGATPGDVVKTGSGTLLLTAANTYTGGTVINGGTVQLGDLANSGSIVGAITVSASTLLDVLNSDLSQVTTITVDSGHVFFEGTNSAAATQISVTGGGGLSFAASATAGQAQISISDNNSVAAFLETASAGDANISVTNGGLVLFQDMASAANGTISVSGGSSVLFQGSATAGNAQISAVQNGPAIAFIQTTTAGTARLSLSQQAILEFQNQASADHAQIVTNSATAVVEFIGSSTAGNAHIDATAGGGIAFFDSSTAGQAQIALGGGANLGFNDMSSGGLATVTTVAGTHVNFAGLTNGGTTIASINGAGDVILGANTLTIGSDNSNSEIGGLVLGTGGLTKFGTGTLTLDGKLAFSGTTTISQGTVVLAGSTMFGGNMLSGNVVDNGTLMFTGSGTLTLSGNVSGSGAVIQNGSGTTILAGTDDYSGSTLVTAGTLAVTGSIANLTLSGGTLQIGDGGTSGAIVGDVVNNGTLVFDRSDSVTFAGAISGSGSVSQIGSGTTVLTGTSTYTGPTTVSAGALDVNGSIANSAVTVNSGATLKGSGAVGGLTLGSGSTIAPGNSIGTLHIAGNVSFASGSIFQVEANPAGMADLIDATGSVTIDHGATVQVIAAPGVYKTGTTFQIVSAAGGVSGTFGSLTLNTAAVTGQLVYGADFVDLVLSQADIDLAPFTHTPNEVATAAAVKAGGPTSTIFGDFLALQPDTAFITGALDQLSGEVHPSLQTAELEDTQVVRQSVLDHLRQSTTGDASGLLTPSAAQSRMIVDGLSMWTHVFAETGSVDSDGNAAEIRQNQSGILAGIDAALDQNLTLGIGGGYTHSHLNQRSSSSRGGDDYIIVSGGWSDGPLAVRAGGSYAWGNRDVVRHVSFPGFAETLTSKQDEHASQVFGEAGYAGKLSLLAFEPFVGITWTDASTAAFSETGGSAALSGRGGDSSLAYSSLGLRLATDAFGGENFAITPRASVAWQHAFGNLRPQQFVSFEDTQKSFLVLGTAIDADMANVDVGLDAKIGDNANLAIGYEGLLSSRVRLNTLHAGLSWSF